MPMMPLDPTVVLQAATQPVEGTIPIWAVGVAVTAVTAPLLVAIRVLYSRNCVLSDREADREAKATEAILTEAHALDQLSKAIADSRAEAAAARTEQAAIRADVAALRTDMAALNARFAS